MADAPRRAADAAAGVRGRSDIDAAGWHRRARRVESPNCDDRPPVAAVELIVVHYISLPPGRFGGDAIERLFTNRLDPSAHPAYRELDGLRVSAHFLVRRDGQLVQFVPTTRRAWHAGVSSFLGCERCNDFSIGIELEGSEHAPFTRAQYRRLAALVRAIARRHPVRFVAGHSDIAPGRKTDPGPQFDWRRFGASHGVPGLRRPFAAAARDTAKSTVR